MAKAPIILTHRGLEPSHPNFYPESSLEAFKDQLSRGFGIEFDPNFAKDGIVVWHDATLSRLSKSQDTRPFAEVSVDELREIKYWNLSGSIQGRIPTLDEVLGLIKESSAPISALHFKGKFQNTNNTELLIKHLQRHSDILPRLLIFDVKPGTAEVLLQQFPDLQLAPSVAHQYDVHRFNSVVAQTLFETDEAVKMLKSGVFGKNPWVWLDEWDLTDENGTKSLYNQAVFDKMRAAGAKIALVTPELHGTSPGLYGGESHPDSKDKETLFKRIEEILSLEPDAICTDYPEEASKLVA